MYVYIPARFYFSYSQMKVTPLVTAQSAGVHLQFSLSTGEMLNTSYVRVHEDQVRIPA